MLVEGDGFVFGEDIDVLALEFLDEQFYHAGRYHLGDTAKYGDLRAVCAGCRVMGQLGARVEITAGRLLVNQNQVRAPSAPEQLAEPVAKIALVENGNGHAAAHPGRSYPP